MTTALILPGHLPGSTIDAQIRSLGVDRIKHLDADADVWADIVTEAKAAADRNDGALFLVSDDLVAADATVAAVVSDSSRRSGLLLGADDPNANPVTVERGLVTGPGPGPWRVGALAKISHAHLRQLRDAWKQDRSGDPYDNLVATFAEAGIPVTAYRTPGIPHRRAADSDSALATRSDIDAIDLDAWRLSNAVKKDDDIFATFAVSSWSPLLVKLAAKLKLQPTFITWISILFAGGAAALYATGGTTTWYIVAALLVYGSFVLDCVDGQLARYTQNFSSFGGWLDMIADRSKEYAIYAGLAAGATAAGADYAWPLAIAAMITQTVRHNVDTWYAVLLDTATIQRAQKRESESDADTRAAQLGNRLGSASDSIMSNRGSVLYWAKRTMAAGVGDRWAVLAISAVIWGPAVALAILLTWQLLAFSYTSAWRTLRTIATKTPAFQRSDTAAHRDDGIAGLFPWKHMPGTYTILGFVAAILACVMAIYEQPYPALTTAAIAIALGIGGAQAAHDGSFNWVIPAGLRAIEFGVITSACVVAGVPYPAWFALIAVIALYFYDLAAGLDKAASPVNDRRWGLGWPVRSGIVVVAAVVDSIAGTELTLWTTLVLAGYVAVIFVGGAVRGMRTAAALLTAFEHIRSSVLNSPEFSYFRRLSWRECSIIYGSCANGEALTASSHSDTGN